MRRMSLKLDAGFRENVAHHSLDYTATKDQGVALLHRKFIQYLPDSFVASTESVGAKTRRA